MMILPSALELQLFLFSLLVVEVAINDVGHFVSYCKYTGQKPLFLYTFIDFSCLDLPSGLGAKYAADKYRNSYINEWNQVSGGYSRTN